MSPEKAKIDDSSSLIMSDEKTNFSKDNLVSIFQSLDGTVKGLKTIVIGCTSQMKTANNVLNNQLEVSKKNKIFGENIKETLNDIVEEQIKIGKKQNGPDFGKILPFKSETEIEEFFSVPQYNQLIEDHIRKAIKGDDLLAQRGLKKIYQEDYVIQTAYADIPEEITNIYMKIAQEDKALLAKWGTKKEIKKLVLKRYSEFRKRIIKKMKL